MTKMKRVAALSIALLLSFGLLGPVLAGSGETVTLEGKLLCAKCTLKEDGRTKCQNVLMVEQDGKKSQYYLAANETNEKYGEVCTKSNAVRVTGQVETKDGQQWLAATDIAPIEG